MKTNTFFSSLLLSSLVLSATACTPRDVAVSNGVRGNIQKYQNKNRGGNSAQGSSDKFTLNTFTLAGVFAEKQIETLEIIKIAQGSTDAEKANFKVAAGEDKGDGVVIVKLDSVTTPVEYDGIEDTWSSKITKNLDVTVPNKEDVVGLSAKIAQRCVNSKTKASVPCKVETTADAVGKKGTFANMIESDYNLNVTAGASENLVKVSLTSKGKFVGSKGSAADSTEMKITLEMVVDKASLATNQVVIVSSNMRAEYQNPTKDKMFFMTLSGANVTASMEPMCNNLIGKHAVAAGDKNKFTAAFDKSSITIEGKNWTKNIAACGKRPTVDVSRLHVY